MHRRAWLAALAAQAAGWLRQPEDRPPAPPLELRDARGRKRSLDEFAGRVVVLSFWATWCGICRREIPLLEKLGRELGSRGLAVVGVALDERGWAAVTPFLAQRPVGYLVLLGDARVARRFAVDGVPRLVVIDRRGRIAAAQAAVEDEAALRRRLEELLEEPPPR